MAVQIFSFYFVFVDLVEIYSVTLFLQLLVVRPVRK